MKCLTALGFKDNTPEPKEIPSEFLIFFRLSGVESSKIESVFKRFKSLSTVQIDYTHPSMGLYFGIRNTGDFEYGVYYHELVPIGTFKLTKSVFNSLKLSELKSASGLKKMLVNLSLNDILLMGKIKLEMDRFTPGYFEQKMVPTVNDRVITFGYYGVSGNWIGTSLSLEDSNHIKEQFKIWVSDKKWSEKILINVSSKDYCVYVNIKLK
jgi:hypothetical protein